MTDHAGPNAKIRANITFEDFSARIEEILGRGPKTDTIEYKEKIATIAGEYRDHFYCPKTKEAKIEWLSWVMDIADLFSAADRDYLKKRLKNNTVSKLQKGEGPALIHAQAIHYRMHACVFDEERTYANDMDRSIFGKVAKTEFGVTIFDPDSLKPEHITLGRFDREGNRKTSYKIAWLRSRYFERGLYGSVIAALIGILGLSLVLNYLDGLRHKEEAEAIALRLGIPLEDTINYSGDELDCLRARFESS